MNSSQLMDRYGYDSVAIGQTFPDAKTMSCFLRDYAMVHGKSLKMDAASGGNRKIFICSDDTCGWEIKGARLKRQTDKVWTIVEVNDAHNQDCESIVVLSGRQLSEIAVFTASIKSNPGQSMIKTMNVVRQVSGVHVNARKRSTICQVGKKKALEDQNDSYEESFTMIESLLT